jgi:hypothetical protein
MKSIDLYTLLQNTILTSNPLINTYLDSPPRGTIADRVAIYAEGFYSRLEDALTNDYRSLATIMGPEGFSFLCRSYIEAYPSCSYSLNFFGQHLSQFLTETPSYKNTPYLAEIALFEWAEYISFVASDANLLSASYLQSLSVNEWPKLQFYFHPSCKILKLNWNSLDLIQTSRNNITITKPTVLKVPQSVMIWRRQRDVRYRKLDDLEESMLSAINQGASFMEICESLSNKMPEEDVAIYLVKELHAWLQEEVFVSRYLESPKL